MPSSTMIELIFEETSHNSTTEALVAEASQLPSVTDGDVVKRASLDPIAVKAWLEVAVVTLPLLTGLIGLIRTKNVRGVRLKVGDSELQVDEASPQALEKLIAALENQVRSLGNSD